MGAHPPESEFVLDTLGAADARLDSFADDKYAKNAQRRDPRASAPTRKSHFFGPNRRAPSVSSSSSASNSNSDASVSSYSDDHDEWSDQEKKPPPPPPMPAPVPAPAPSLSATINAMRKRAEIPLAVAVGPAPPRPPAPAPAHKRKSVASASVSASDHGHIPAPKRAKGAKDKDNTFDGLGTLGPPPQAPIARVTVSSTALANANASVMRENTVSSEGCALCRMGFFPAIDRVKWTSMWTLYRTFEQLRSQLTLDMLAQTIVKQYDATVYAEYVRDGETPPVWTDRMVQAHLIHHVPRCDTAWELMRSIDELSQLQERAKADAIAASSSDSGAHVHVNKTKLYLELLKMKSSILKDLERKVAGAFD